MEKELLDKYKIRDYYMIPNEIIDNIFYEFETQLKKQKEIIDKVKEWEQSHTILVYTKKAPKKFVGTYELLHILYEDKEV